IEAALVLILDQIGPDAFGIIAGLVGRADQHDVARMQHRVDALDNRACVRRRRPGLRRAGGAADLSFHVLTLLLSVAGRNAAREPRPWPGFRSCSKLSYGELC